MLIKLLHGYFLNRWRHATIRTSWLLQLRIETLLAHAMATVGERPVIRGYFASDVLKLLLSSKLFLDCILRVIPQID